MSNDMNRPAPSVSAPHTHHSVSADRPTATYPTGWLIAEAAGRRVDPAGYLPEGAEGGAAAACLEEADATPTAVLPAEATTRAALFPEVRPLRERPAGPSRHEGGDAAFIARTEARGRARVYHTPRTKGRWAGRAGRAGRRHLRAALTAIALAAAILTGLQLYAAAGITSARQAALAARTEGAAPAATSAAAPAAAPSSTMSGQTPAPATMSDRTSAAPMSGQTAAWVTQDSGAPYNRTDPSASPLALPRCTTSPTTPMPCLAHVSADSRHAVVLEEDASLTGLVRR